VIVTEIDYSLVISNSSRCTSDRYVTVPIGTHTKKFLTSPHPILHQPFILKLHRIFSKRTLFNLHFFRYPTVIGQSSNPLHCSLTVPIAIHTKKFLIYPHPIPHQSSILKLHRIFSKQTKHSCRIGKRLPSANDLPRPGQLPGNLPGNEEVLKDIIAWFGLYRSEKVHEHWPVKG
jgi:hypothetical protein